MAESTTEEDMTTEEIENNTDLNEKEKAKLWIKMQKKRLGIEVKQLEHEINKVGGELRYLMGMRDGLISSLQGNWSGKKADEVREEIKKIDQKYLECCSKRRNLAKSLCSLTSGAGKYLL